MNRDFIKKQVRAALLVLVERGVLSAEIPPFQIEVPKDRAHGDFSTSVALMLAKAAGLKPREIAEKIQQVLPDAKNIIMKTEIAGPGFINFFLFPAARFSVVTEVLAAGKKYGESKNAAGERVLLEFVSTNPTGPLHVGHGRQGAFGAVVANLLETQGIVVTREYYVNDAGRQMDILAVSVWLRYLAILQPATFSFPSSGYCGEYVTDIAQSLHARHEHAFGMPPEKVFSDLPLDEPQGGDREIYIDALVARMKSLLGSANYEIVFLFALDTVMADIREDLEISGVWFDNWFSERAFTRTDAVDKTIQALSARGLTYEKEGALWFRATEFNDEKDRVLRRSNGAHTYFANDLAYHADKFARGFDRVIDIFGADHHGYLARMKAGLQALGISPERLTFLLLQFVMLYRKGEQVQMSTRSGSFITLRELREEAGADATRFFYLQRRAEQHVDFDLDLAKAESDENPVYYIQYAHARICSVFRQLAEKGMTWTPGLLEPGLLSDPHEEALAGLLAHYPDMLSGAAGKYEPQILTSYLRELANGFHGYYNACVFLVEEKTLRDARLSLIAAVRQVIVNGLELLGISAPEKM
jgi:arginyl-tRNA synthetase